MDADKFLTELLDKQELKDDSKEVLALEAERERVEKLIKKEFKDGDPTISYGGSKAKGTMNLESYDLDLPLYFACDDDPDHTLKDIFTKVATALEKEYYVERRRSALRLKKKGNTEVHEDFRIDVVPGRYTDDEKSDSFLYINDPASEKERLKTNLQKHIDHVKNSGFVEEIRLAKLWKVRIRLDVKTFVLELLVIKVLSDGKCKEGLSSNMKYFWTKIHDGIDNMKVEDPANPTGNDLSALFNAVVKADLKAAAKSALKKIGDDRENGWAHVFGEEVKKEPIKRIEVLGSGVIRGPKPWRS